MTTYTAEDFKKARFALNNGEYTACRSREGLWNTEGERLLSDEEIANEDNWVPIVPGRDTLKTWWDNGEVITSSNLPNIGDELCEVTEDGNYEVWVVEYEFTGWDESLENLYASVRIINRMPPTIPLEIENLIVKWDNAEVITNDNLPKKGDVAIIRYQNVGCSVMEILFDWEFTNHTMTRILQRKGE